MFFYAGTLFGYAAFTVLGPIVAFVLHDLWHTFAEARKAQKAVRAIDTHERLRQIVVASTWHRERQDAYHEEVCERLHVDPNVISVERDWCAEIVYEGTPPDVIQERLDQQRLGFQESHHPNWKAKW